MPESKKNSKRFRQKRVFAELCQQTLGAYENIESRRCNGACPGVSAEIL